MSTKVRKEATFGLSLLVMIAIIGILLLGIIALGLDPQIPLIMAAAIGLCYAMYLGIGWKDVEKQITVSISESIQAMIIIILIGMVVGSWMSCGTVPFIIYYGLQILSPSMFLVTSLIICSIMSIMTGSSWTTMGTVGVALMGIGYGLGVPTGMTAGAIVCGAYFGDKLSPLSDTSNFAAGVAKVNIYECVHAMIYTTGPAWVVSAVLFTILGLRFAGSNVDYTEVNIMLEALDGAFNLSPLLLIPPIVLITLVIKKAPAIPSMIIGVALGAVLAVLIQGESWSSALTYLQSGYVGSTGLENVDNLLTRGGLNSMMFTISLMFASLSLAALLEVTGITVALISKLSGVISNLPGLVLTTILSGISLNFLAADPYLATLLPGRTFAPAFDEKGLHRKTLARTIQDGGVVWAPLVPWGSNGIYTATVLGISITEYLPYYFMALTPVFAVICAITGIGIFYKDSDGKAVTKKKSAV